MQDGSVNRSAIPVDLEAGEAFAALVEISRIRPASGDHAEIQATFRNTTAGGDPVLITDLFLVIPQPRARLVAPPNLPSDRLSLADGEAREGAERRRGEHASLKVGWGEAVEVRARLENPWDVPTGPLPLALRAQGRLVAERTVPSLTPGESRPVTVANVTRQELARGRHQTVSPGESISQQVRVSLGLTGQAGGDSTRLYNYTFPAREMAPESEARGVVEFRGGIWTSFTGTNLTLGTASQVSAEVRNWGGLPAQPVPLDLRVGPVPDLAYGVDSDVTRSLVVDLAPGEGRFVNFSFTPRVDAPHELSASLEYGSRTSGTSRTTAVQSPVDVQVREGRKQTLRVGETATVTLAVTGPSTTGGGLGAVASVQAASEGRGGSGTPFSTLLTTRDLVGASFQPGAIEAEEAGSGGGSGGGRLNVSIPAELTPRAAGQVAVVPYLRSGGLVYTGLEDARAVSGIFDEAVERDDARDALVSEQPFGPPPGIVGLSVLPSGPPGPAVVVPPALVLLGVAGIEVHRRLYVR